MPSHALTFLTARRTRVVLAWAALLVAVGHRAGQGWLNFRAADRSDGNHGHTSIDFGGQCRENQRDGATERPRSRGQKRFRRPASPGPTNWQSSASSCLRPTSAAMPATCRIVKTISATGAR